MESLEGGSVGVSHLSYLKHLNLVEVGLHNQVRHDSQQLKDMTVHL